MKIEQNTNYSAVNAKTDYSSWSRQHAEWVNNTALGASDSAGIGATKQTNTDGVMIDFSSEALNAAYGANAPVASGTEFLSTLSRMLNATLGSGQGLTLNLAA